MKSSGANLLSLFVLSSLACSLVTGAASRSTPAAPAAPEEAAPTLAEAAPAITQAAAEPATPAGQKPGAAPLRPFPQHTSYAANTIRPSQYSQAQQDDDVRAFYDYWKAAYLMEAGTSGEGNPLYRISYGSTNPGRTVSEGQGYGMLIVALMAGYETQAQAIFDGLWEFSRQHPSDIDPRLMGWQIPPDETGNDSAFDGDADIAYALLLADAQWGSEGRIDYEAAAQQVMAAILESTIGPQSRLPLLGDWIDPDDATHNQYTPRSSDFMPAHFRAYGRATGDPAWTEVVNNTQAVVASLQTNYSPNTGLLPDFIVPTSPSDHTPRPAPPNFLEADSDGSYSYNACRDPWRIGRDALLNGDATSWEQARKMSQWAEAATGGDPAALHAGYALDGAPLPDTAYFSSAFAAPLAVSAMLDPAQQGWLDALYALLRSDHEDYYEDSLNLLALLTLSGNDWDAGISPVPPTARIYLPLVRQGS